jgi:hypothetical protein
MRGDFLCHGRTVFARSTKTTVRYYLRVYRFFYSYYISLSRLCQHVFKQIPALSNSRAPRLRSQNIQYIYIYIYP